MALFDKSIEKQKDKASQEIKKVMPSDEKIEKVFLTKIDFCAFTNKRLIFVDHKLLTSKKTLTSVSYSKINFVALKRGGFLNISKEVMIGVGGSVLEIETYSEDDAFEIVRMINEMI